MTDILHRNPLPDGFYSSDIECPGASYEGASMYKVKLNWEMKAEGEGEKIKSLSEKGKLLYDVKIQDGEISYLFTENYISESNLVIESNKLD